MPTAYSKVNLSELPSPAVVETLSFESIFSEMISDLVARDSTFTALVESDPAFKILEVCAYREVLLRQRVNEAAQSVMLAYALGADLDQIAARYGVTRLLITAEDLTTTPPTPAVYEGDEEFRNRTLLSLEGFTTAGSRGSYIFHALSASGDCKDVGLPATPLVPGRVDVAILSRTGTGVPPQSTLDAVASALSAEDVRPLCDTVAVQAASVVNYTVQAALTLYPGSAQAQVLAAAQSGVEALVLDCHKLGRDVTRSALFAALHVPGVQNVALVNPTNDLVNGWNQAPYCTGISVVVSGTGE